MRVRAFVRFANDGDGRHPSSVTSTATPHRTRRFLQAAASRDATFAVALFCLSLSVNLGLVHAANTQGYLTAEEASVCFRNAVLLLIRFQADGWATYGGGHLFYLLGAQLLPHVDLFFGRTCKAIAMAGLAPLALLFARRVLRLARVPAVWAGLTIAFLPGILSFSWMAIEAGLDTAFGILALLLLSSRRDAAVLLGGFFAGYAVSCYGGGLDFLPPAAYLLALRLGRYWSARSVFAAVGACLLAAGAIYAPALWWTNSHAIIFGGGHFAPAGADSNLRSLWKEFAVQGGSYYNFSPIPAVSSLPFVLACLLGLVLAIPSLRVWAPAYLIIAAGTFVCAVAGAPTGARRALPVMVSLCLFAAFLVNRLYLSRARALRFIAVVLAVASLAVSARQAWTFAELFRDETIPLRTALFTFTPLHEGMTMKQSFDALTVDPDAVDFLLQTAEPARGLTTLYGLRNWNRSVETPPLPLERIRRLFLTGR